MVDNSKNGGETVGKIDKDGEAQTIEFNCGTKAVLTIFQVIVLVVITTFMVYGACRILRHFHAVFLKRQQVALLKKEKGEKQIRDKLILEIELQAGSQSAETYSARAADCASINGSALDTT